MHDPELSPDRVEEMRGELGLAAPAPVDETATPFPPAPTPASTGVRARLEAAVRSRLSPWKRRARVLVRGVDPRTVGRMTFRLDQRDAELVATVDALRAEVRSLAVWVGASDPGHLGRKVDALTTNLELIKGELRGIESRIEDLGAAIAPGAGLVGAAPRMAELRERLNAIDRRVRLLSDTTDALRAANPPAAADTRTPAGTGPATIAPPPAPGVAADQPSADERTAPEVTSSVDGDAAAGASTDATATGGSGFDYVGFEQRFRGDPSAILEIQRERYLEQLRGHQPVLDVGCGRGELLQLLAEEGVEGLGVDLDAGMVAEAVAGGVDAHHGDAIAFLRDREPRSLGAIISTHVVEHLPLDSLIELLELSASRLRPGGLFIAETPNPATLLVLGNSYVMDPTHVWPLHPSLLTFLCERAGFRHVDLLFGAPATDYQLALLPEEGPTAELAPAINPSLQRLNDVLFGPQEYAVLARTPEA